MAERQLDQGGAATKPDEIIRIAEQTARAASQPRRETTSLDVRVSVSAAHSLALQVKDSAGTIADRLKLPQAQERGSQQQRELAEQVTVIRQRFGALIKHEIPAQNVDQETGVVIGRINQAHQDYAKHGLAAANGIASAIERGDFEGAKKLALTLEQRADHLERTVRAEEGIANAHGSTTLMGHVAEGLPIYERGETERARVLAQAGLDSVPRTATLMSTPGSVALDALLKQTSVLADTTRRLDAAELASTTSSIRNVYVQTDQITSDRLDNMNAALKQMRDALMAMRAGDLSVSMRDETTKIIDAVNSFLEKTDAKNPEGRKTVSEEELRGVARLVMEAQDVLNTLADANMPQGMRSQLESAYLNMLRSIRSGLPKTADLLSTAAEEIKKHGKASGPGAKEDAAYRAELVAGAKAVAEAKTAQEREAAEKTLLGKMAKHTRDELARQAANAPGEVGTLLSGIAKGLEKPDGITLDALRMARAVQNMASKLDGYSRILGSMQEKERAETLQVFARGLKALSQGNFPVAELQFTLAEGCMQPKATDVQKAEFKKLSQQLERNPNAAEAVRYYIKLNREILQMRKDAEKLRAESPERKAMDNIITELEKIRARVAETGSAAGKQDVDKRVPLVQKRMEENQEFKDSILDLAQKTKGPNESDEQARDRIIQLYAMQDANEAQRGIAAKLQEAAGSFMRALSTFKRGPERKNATEIFNSAVNQYLAGSISNGDTFRNAGESYTRLTSERDRSDLMGVVRDITSRERKPEDALFSELDSRRLAVFGEWSKCDAQVKDPKIRSNARAYFDLAFRVAGNKNPSEFQGIMDLAAGYAALALVPVDNLTPDQKADRQQRMDAITAQLGDFSRLKGRLLDFGIIGREKSAPKERYVPSHIAWLLSDPSRTLTEALGRADKTIEGALTATYGRKPTEDELAAGYIEAGSRKLSDILNLGVASTRSAKDIEFDGKANKAEGDTSKRGEAAAVRTYDRTAAGLRKKAKAAESKGDRLLAEYYETEAKRVDRGFVHSSISEARVMYKQGRREQDEALALGNEATEAKDATIEQSRKRIGELRLQLEPDEAKGLDQMVAAAGNDLAKLRQYYAGVARIVAQRKAVRGSELIEDANRVVDGTATYDRSVRKVTTRRSSAGRREIMTGINVLTALAKGVDVDLSGQPIAKPKPAPGVAPAEQARIPQTRRGMLRSHGRSMVAIGSDAVKEQERVQEQRNSIINDAVKDIREANIQKLRGFIKRMIQEPKEGEVPLIANGALRDALRARLETIMKLDDPKEKTKQLQQLYEEASAAARVATEAAPSGAFLGVKGDQLYEGNNHYGNYTSVVGLANQENFGAARRKLGDSKTAIRIDTTNVGIALTDRIEQVRAEAARGGKGSGFIASLHVIDAERGTVYAGLVGTLDQIGSGKIKATPELLANIIAQLPEDQRKKYAERLKLLSGPDGDKVRDGIVTDLRVSAEQERAMQIGGRKSILDLVTEGRLEASPSLLSNVIANLPEEKRKKYEERLRQIVSPRQKNERFTLLLELSQETIDNSWLRKPSEGQVGTGERNLLEVVGSGGLVYYDTNYFLKRSMQARQLLRSGNANAANAEMANLDSDLQVAETVQSNETRRTGESFGKWKDQEERDGARKRLIREYQKPVNEHGMTEDKPEGERAKGEREDVNSFIDGRVKKIEAASDESIKLHEESETAAREARDHVIRTRSVLNVDTRLAGELLWALPEEKREQYLPLLRKMDEASRKGADSPKARAAAMKLYEAIQKNPEDMGLALGRIRAEEKEKPEIPHVATANMPQLQAEYILSRNSNTIMQLAKARQLGEEGTSRMAVELERGNLARRVRYLTQNEQYYNTERVLGWSPKGGEYRASAAHDANARAWIEWTDAILKPENARQAYDIFVQNRMITADGFHGFGKAEREWHDDKRFELGSEKRTGPYSFGAADQLAGLIQSSRMQVTSYLDVDAMENSRPRMAAMAEAEIDDTFLRMGVRRVDRGDYYGLERWAPKSDEQAVAFAQASGQLRQLLGRMDGVILGQADPSLLLGQWIGSEEEAYVKRVSERVASAADSVGMAAKGGAYALEISKKSYEASVPYDAQGKDVDKPTTTALGEIQTWASYQRVAGIAVDIAAIAVTTFVAPEFLPAVFMGLGAKGMAEGYEMREQAGEWTGEAKFAFGMGLGGMLLIPLSEAAQVTRGAAVLRAMEKGAVEGTSGARLLAAEAGMSAGFKGSRLATFVNATAADQEVMLRSAQELAKVGETTLRAGTESAQVLRAGSAEATSFFGQTTRLTRVAEYFTGQPGMTNFQRLVHVGGQAMMGAGAYKFISTYDEQKARVVSGESTKAEFILGIWQSLLQPVAQGVFTIRASGSAGHQGGYINRGEQLLAAVTLGIPMQERGTHIANRNYAMAQREVSRMPQEAQSSYREFTSRNGVMIEPAREASILREFNTQRQVAEKSGGTLRFEEFIAGGKGEGAQVLRVAAAEGQYQGIRDLAAQGKLKPEMLTPFQKAFAEARARGVEPAEAFAASMTAQAKPQAPPSAPLAPGTRAPEQAQPPSAVAPLRRAAEAGKLRAEKDGFALSFDQRFTSTSQSGGTGLPTKREYKVSPRDRPSVSIKFTEEHVAAAREMSYQAERILKAPESEQWRMLAEVPENLRHGVKNLIENPEFKGTVLTPDGQARPVPDRRAQADISLEAVGRTPGFAGKPEIAKAAREIEALRLVESKPGMEDLKASRRLLLLRAKMLETSNPALSEAYKSAAKIVGGEIEARSAAAQKAKPPPLPTMEKPAPTEAAAQKAASQKREEAVLKIVTEMAERLPEAQRPAAIEEAKRVLGAFDALSRGVPLKEIVRTYKLNRDMLEALRGRMQTSPEELPRELANLAMDPLAARRSAVANRIGVLSQRAVSGDSNRYISTVMRWLERRYGSDIPKDLVPKPGATLHDTIKSSAKALREMLQKARENLGFEENLFDGFRRFNGEVRAGADLVSSLSENGRMPREAQPVGVIVLDGAKTWMKNGESFGGERYSNHDRAHGGGELGDVGLIVYMEAVRRFQQKNPEVYTKLQTAEGDEVVLMIRGNRLGTNEAEANAAIKRYGEEFKKVLSEVVTEFGIDSKSPLHSAMAGVNAHGGVVGVRTNKDGGQSFHYEGREYRDLNGALVSLEVEGSLRDLASRGSTPAERKDNATTAANINKMIGDMLATTPESRLVQLKVDGKKQVDPDAFATFRFGFEGTLRRDVTRLAENNGKGKAAAQNGMAGPSVTNQLGHPFTDTVTSHFQDAIVKALRARGLEGKVDIYVDGPMTFAFKFKGQVDHESFNAAISEAAQNFPALMRERGVPIINKATAASKVVEPVGTIRPTTWELQNGRWAQRELTPTERRDAAEKKARDRMKAEVYGAYQANVRGADAVMGSLISNIHLFGAPAVREIFTEMHGKGKLILDENVIAALELVPSKKWIRTSEDLLQHLRDSNVPEANIDAFFRQMGFENTQRAAEALPGAKRPAGTGFGMEGGAAQAIPLAATGTDSMAVPDQAAQAPTKRGGEAPARPESLTPEQNRLAQSIGNNPESITRLASGLASGNKSAITVLEQLGNHPLRKVIEGVSKNPEFRAAVASGDTATIRRFQSEVAASPMRYFSEAEFRALHPEPEGTQIYHNQKHTENTARAAHEITAARETTPQDAAVFGADGTRVKKAEFVAQVALLHDIDPSSARKPGTPASVARTLEWMDSAQGQSIMRTRFGWDDTKITMAKAIIARTDFPFSPAAEARYTSLLQSLQKGGRGDAAAVAAREAPILSEYADKSSWYYQRPADALASVRGLNNEIAAVTPPGKPPVDMLPGTHGFVSKIGDAAAFEADVRVAKQLGINLGEGFPPGRDAMLARMPQAKLNFEANVEMFRLVSQGTHPNIARARAEAMLAPAKAEAVPGQTQAPIPIRPEAQQKRTETAKAPEAIRESALAVVDGYISARPVADHTRVRQTAMDLYDVLNGRKPMPKDASPEFKKAIEEMKAQKVRPEEVPLAISEASMSIEYARSTRNLGDAVGKEPKAVGDLAKNLMEALYGKRAEFTPEQERLLFDFIGKINSAVASGKPDHLAVIEAAREMLGGPGPRGGGPRPTDGGPGGKGPGTKPEERGPALKPGQPATDTRSQNLANAEALGRYVDKVVAAKNPAEREALLAALPKGVRGSVERLANGPYASAPKSGKNASKAKEMLAKEAKAVRLVLRAEEAAQPVVLKKAAGAEGMEGAPVAIAGGQRKGGSIRIIRGAATAEDTPASRGAVGRSPGQTGKEGDRVSQTQMATDALARLSGNKPENAAHREEFVNSVLSINGSKLPEAERASIAASLADAMKMPAFGGVRTSRDGKVSLKEPSGYPGIFLLEINTSAGKIRAVYKAREVTDTMMGMSIYDTLGLPRPKTTRLGDGTIIQEYIGLGVSPENYLAARSPERLAQMTPAERAERTAERERLFMDYGEHAAVDLAIGKPDGHLNQFVMVIEGEQLRLVCVDFENTGLGYGHGITNPTRDHEKIWKDGLLRSYEPGDLRAMMRGIDNGMARIRNLSKDQVADINSQLGFNKGKRFGRGTLDTERIKATRERIDQARKDPEVAKYEMVEFMFDIWRRASEHPGEGNNKALAAEAREVFREYMAGVKDEKVVRRARDYFTKRKSETMRSTSPDLQRIRYANEALAIIDETHPPAGGPKGGKPRKPEEGGGPKQAEMPPSREAQAGPQAKGSATVLRAGRHRNAQPANDNAVAPVARKPRIVNIQDAREAKAAEAARAHQQAAPPTQAQKSADAASGLASGADVATFARRMAQGDKKALELYKSMDPQVKAEIRMRLADPEFRKAAAEPPPGTVDLMFPSYVRRNKQSLEDSAGRVQRRMNELSPPQRQEARMTGTDNVPVADAVGNAIAQPGQAGREAGQPRTVAMLGDRYIPDTAVRGTVDAFNAAGTGSLDMSQPGSRDIARMRGLIKQGMKPEDAARVALEERPPASRAELSPKARELFDLAEALLSGNLDRLRKGSEELKKLPPNEQDAVFYMITEGSEYKSGGMPERLLFAEMLGGDINAEAKGKPREIPSKESLEKIAKIADDIVNGDKDAKANAKTRLAEDSILFTPEEARAFGRFYRSMRNAPKRIAPADYAADYIQTRIAQAPTPKPQKAPTPKVFTSEAEFRAHIDGIRSEVTYSGQYVERISNSKKVVAIGDVHGDVYGAVDQLLRSGVLIDTKPNLPLRDASISPSERFKLNPSLEKDTDVVFMGDLIDRGAHSIQAVDFVRRLQADAKAAGVRVHTIRGNHEELFLKFVQAHKTWKTADVRSAIDGDMQPALFLMGGWKRIGIGDTFDSILAKYAVNGDISKAWEAFIKANFDAQGKPIPGSEIDFLTRTKGAVIIDNNYFTHAGPVLAYTPPGQKNAVPVRSPADLDAHFRGMFEAEQNGMTRNMSDPRDIQRGDFSIDYASNWVGKFDKDGGAWRQAMGIDHVYVGHERDDSGVGVRSPSRYVTNLDVAMSERYGGGSGILIIDPLNRSTPVMIAERRGEVPASGSRAAKPAVDNARNHTDIMLQDGTLIMRGRTDVLKNDVARAADVFFNNPPPPQAAPKTPPLGSGSKPKQAPVVDTESAMGIPKGALAQRNVAVIVDRTGAPKKVFGAGNTEYNEYRVNVGGAEIAFFLPANTRGDALVAALDNLPRLAPGKAHAATEWEAAGSVIKWNTSLEMEFQNRASRDVNGTLLLDQTAYESQKPLRAIGRALDAIARSNVPESQIPTEYMPAIKRLRQAQSDPNLTEVARANLVLNEASNMIAERYKAAKPSMEWNNVATVLGTPNHAQTGDAIIAFTKHTAANQESVIRQLHGWAEMKDAEATAHTAAGRNPEAAAARDYADTLRHQACALSEMKSVIGPMGQRLERELGLPAGTLRDAYMYAPSIEAARKAVLDKAGIKLGNYKDDHMAGMLFTGDLVGILRGLHPDAASMEMKYLGGGATGAFIVNVVGKDGVARREFVKKVDMRADAAGARNLRLAGIPAPDVIATRQDGSPLQYSKPDGTMGGFGVSRDIAAYTETIVVNGKRIEMVTQRATFLNDLVKSPEAMEMFMDHPDIFFSLLGHKFAAEFATGSIDGHGGNTALMSMVPRDASPENIAAIRASKGKVQKVVTDPDGSTRLVNVELNVFTDGQGRTSVIQNGRIDTDDSAGTYWAEGQRGNFDFGRLRVWMGSHHVYPQLFLNLTRAHNHQEALNAQAYRRFEIPASYEKSYRDQGWTVVTDGGKRYVESGNPQDAATLQAAGLAPDPAYLNGRSPKFISPLQLVERAFGTRNDGPFFQGVKRWTGEYQYDPAFRSAMQQSFASYDWKPAGVSSFPVFDQMRQDQIRTDGITYQTFPNNGESRMLAYSTDGRTNLPSDYERVRGVNSWDPAVQAMFPQNQFMWVAPVPSADFASRMGIPTFKNGSKTFGVFPRYESVPDAIRPQALWAIRHHENMRTAPGFGQATALPTQRLGASSVFEYLNDPGANRISMELKAVADEFRAWERNNEKVLDGNDDAKKRQFIQERLPGGFDLSSFPTRQPPAP